MKIVIAGGGIGGFSAALALARAGHDIEVVEQAAELREVGAGLQLSPNAVKGLEALGVARDVEAVSSEPGALELRIGRSGATVFSIPMGKAARRRYGAPYLHIHRADLLNILAKKAETAGVSIRLGARVSAWAREGQRLRIGLDTGAIRSGDLLVGADGMRSAVRRRLFGDSHPRFTGAIAWRALAPISAFPNLPAAAVVWAGPGRHAVTYRIRRGELINFVGVVEEDGWREEGWDVPGDKRKLREAFDGGDEAVTRTIDGAHATHRWALFDRDPLPGWSQGMVTLLGDACHPLPPFQAQGAAMAIEDAVVLANCLRAHHTPEAALAAYEAKRKPRTSKVLASARSNMNLFHRSNAFTQAATYGPMRIAGMLAPMFVNSRQDWIYGFDPTRS
jgi:salicylate hydroxylase